MQDNCYTYMHVLHYSYGMMQCINTPAPELMQDMIRAGNENDAEDLRRGECGGRRDIVGGTDVQKTWWDRRTETRQGESWEELKYSEDSVETGYRDEEEEEQGNEQTGGLTHDVCGQGGPS